MVRLRVEGQPWLRVADTGWTFLLSGELREKGETLVSQYIVKQMDWDDVEVGGIVKLKIRFGSEAFEHVHEARVIEAASPSFSIGEALIKELYQEGWQIGEASFLLGEGEGDLEPAVVEPTVAEDQDQLWWGDCHGIETGEEEESAKLAVEHEAFWRRAIEDHTLAAVGGEEPGGLVSGAQQWRPPEHLLREVNTQVGELSKKDLPAGPWYPTAEDNPDEYKGIVEKFIPGHIHDKVDEWRRLQPRVDEEVLAWVEQGYEVKEHQAAMGIRCRNGKVARENEEAVRALLLKRLREGSWEMTNSDEVINIVPINLAPKPSAAIPWRWLINGMPVNEHYAKWKVRYEGLHTLPLVLKPGDWMVSLDLHSGYDALKLQKKSRGLFAVRVVLLQEQVEALLQEGLLEVAQLGRQFADGTVEVFARPVTLPQGFTLSCGIFTKLTRQMVRVWRSRGWRLAHLLDDLLFADQDPVKLMAIVVKVLDELKRLGFFVAWDKCILKPTQVMKWVGFVIDTVKFVFQVPGEKVEAFEALVSQFLRSPDEWIFRKMAQVAGKLLSMGVAIPPARLFTRETYKCIRPENDWDAKGEVTPAMAGELLEAVTWLRPFNFFGAPIRRKAKMQSLRLMLDGSQHGFGLRLDGQWRDVSWGDTSIAVAAQWQGETREAQVHRELLALEEALKLPDLPLERGASILLWPDCMGTVRYVNKGAGSSDVLSHIMRRIWRRCIELGVSMYAEHVPGTLLVIAGVDALSRSTEFVLAGSCFQNLMRDRQFGQRGDWKGCTVDLCASEKTARLRRYCSKNHVSAGSMGDARSVQLSPLEYYYVCPPIGLIGKMLQRLEEASVAAVVVVPNWEAQAWHVWLRDRAVDAAMLPWRSYPAVWLDVADKKPKGHEMAQRFEFIAFALDFRPAARHEARGVRALG